MKSFIRLTALTAAMAAACSGSTNAATGGSGADGGGDDGGSGDAGPTTTPLARGLSISIAVFQGTKALVVQDGVLQATPKAPVIAGRPGVVRVYVKPDASWQGHDVTCELRMTAAGTELPLQTATLTVAGASSDDTPDSAFDFPFTADQMPPGTTFSVAIRDSTAPAQADDATGAWFPNDGTLADFAALDKTQLDIIFVPLKYDVDGSGRLPDTSAAQMKLFHDTLYKLYPSSKVTITLHAPVAWTQAIEPTGQGWDIVLQELIDLRQQEAPPANTYYVSTFQPAATLGKFCGNGGCVLGIAPGGVGPGDIYDRIALTLGYTGGEGPDTLTQELAHAMGREHAPCGSPAGPDPKYPYSGAAIGVWGYNVLTKNFINPHSLWRDLLSYCTPIWISDYTYNALAKRLNFVNKSVRKEYVPTGPSKYQWVSVRPNGSLVPGRVMTLDIPPQGVARAMTFHAADGHAIATDVAHYYAYGGQPGGFMFVPVAPSGAVQMRVEGFGSGATANLAR